MKHSGKVALGGMIGALSLVSMLLTLVPSLTYALPALAGALLIPLVIELGVRWSWMVYVVVALLSLLVAPDKQAAVFYIAFFGYYPILKAVLERRLHKRTLEWGGKLAVFNIAMIACYLVLLFVLHLNAEEFTIFGRYLPLVFLLIGNVIFVVYDVALTNVIALYLHRLHPRLKTWFK